MKRMWKSLAVILAIMMMAIVFVSCQGNTGQATADQSGTATQEATPDSAPAEAEPAEAAAGAQTELVVWVPSRGPELEEVYAKVVDEFQQANPDVNVTIEFVSHTDMQAKAQAAILAGTTPDIIRDQIGRNGTYMNADLFVPLDDVFTEEYKAKFFAPVLEQGTKDGSVYIFPEMADYYMLNVNKTLFDEAGATDLLPLDGDRTWTREEFEQAMEAVSKDGVYGMGLWAANEQSDINTKILIEGGMGTSLYSDDFQTVQYDSPTAIAGLEWLVSLVDKGYAVPESANLTDDEVWQLFAQKKVAVLATTSEPINWIPTQIADGNAEEPFEIVVVQFPTAAGDTPKTAAPMTGYGIFKNEEDADKIAAAKAFLQFVSESSYSAEIVSIFGSYPAAVANGDMYKDHPEFNWISNTLGNYVYDAGYASNGFADVRLVLYPEIQAAFAGMKTPEQAMTDFTQMANDILAQANAA